MLAQTEAQINWESSDLIKEDSQGIELWEPERVVRGAVSAKIREDPGKIRAKARASALERPGEVTAGDKIVWE